MNRRDQLWYEEIIFSRITTQKKPRSCDYISMDGKKATNNEHVWYECTKKVGFCFLHSIIVILSSNESVVDQSIIQLLFKTILRLEIFVECICSGRRTSKIDLTLARKEGCFTSGYNLVQIRTQVFILRMTWLETFTVLQLVVVVVTVGRCPRAPLQQPVVHVVEVFIEVVVQVVVEGSAAAEKSRSRKRGAPGCLSCRSIFAPQLTHLFATFFHQSFVLGNSKDKFKFNILVEIEIVETALMEMWITSAFCRRRCKCVWVLVDTGSQDIFPCAFLITYIKKIHF